MISKVIVGLFLVMVVEIDYDGKYNILLEHIDTGDLVELRTTNPPPFKEGSSFNAKIKAECDNTRVGEVLEGRAQDSYYVNRMTHLCSSQEKHMEIIK